MEINLRSDSSNQNKIMLDSKNKGPTPDLTPGNERKGQLSVAVGFHGVYTIYLYTTDVSAINTYSNKKGPFPSPYGFLEFTVLKYKDHLLQSIVWYISL